MKSATTFIGLLATAVIAAPSARRSDATHPAGQVAFSFPLEDGFPNIQPNSAALKAIQTEAHGTLPNGPLPKKIADASAGVWSLIAANELFEVAYFSSLINNITNCVPGYEIGSPAAREAVLLSLKAVRAQEQLHALGANGILATAGRKPIQPCRYVFPVSNFNDAIAFAATFTDVVLGTLQGALQSFGLAGDTDFLGLVGSVIGQEGEQNGFYRILGPQLNIPSALPFLTASAGPFALSSLVQNVIVPNSCPDTLPVPTFKPLKVITPNVGPHTVTIDFSVPGKASDAPKWRVAYINQQNTPVVVNIANVQQHGEDVTFTAPFPYSEYLMNGLTISAVTKGAGPFANAGAVANATLFGPGLIEIN